MAKLNENHTFGGMQRDLSISKHPIQFLYDAKNIRLTAREGNSLLSITNEKGTSDTTVTVDGDYLGHCLLNEYLVVFSTQPDVPNVGNIDYITRINLSDVTSKQLYSGSHSDKEDLGFSLKHPIEAIGSYETESIQKIYWTDGNNQPRIINISPDMDSYITNYNANSFDFIPDLDLKENVRVEKLLGASGEFAPGVIQYAFTYYNKYGQESNIFYITPLYYISFKERGAKPDDKVENAFKITVNNIDRKFEYLRIYSIQRTSLNATPFCKRIQDINLKDLPTATTSVSYTDTGLSGNSVDPIELLYKGGEPIKAGTLEQKDNTLFFGDISLERPHLRDIESTIQSTVTPTLGTNTRDIVPVKVSGGSYTYYNQLSSYSYESGAKDTVPCAGFKYGDWYRLGVQFQHKSGRWSDPIFLTDKQQDQLPSDGSSITLPIFKGTISGELATTLWGKDYRKVRAVVVYPEAQDRITICQGVVNPTLWTNNMRNIDKNLYAQSSWFFRPTSPTLVESTVKVAPTYSGTLPYTSRQIDNENPVNPGTAYDPDPSSGFKIRQVEIQGDFESDNQFKIDSNFVTLHSPDIEFDDYISVMDMAGLEYRLMGDVRFRKTMSDIDIQTESPTVSNSGSGFVHKSFTTDGPWGIVAGLFYDDYIVDDCLGDDNHLGAYPKQRAACKYMVFPWQGSGSLNNDMNRPADKGTATAILKKKVISHLRYATTAFTVGSSTTDIEPQLYNSEETQIVKVGDNIYQGNIDTSLVPDNADGQYFCFDGYIHMNIGLPADYWVMGDAKTSFASNAWFKTWSMNPDIQNQNGLRYWNTTDKKWYWCSGIGDDSGDDIGDEFVDLDMRKNPVRMKYKSTPHIVFSSSVSLASSDTNSLKLIQIERAKPANIFGGTSDDAKKENTWIPCGKPVNLVSGSPCDFYYSWGDTYFQRYDCLKTYPFSREDPNQIVEIGSFMVETHVNIDGRYDRNRGQSNNLNMSPQNFNLMNPVYNQLNNFFTYKIQDKDFYNNTRFPHQVTWTKEKNAGADVDNWTNITLASTYDMDGSKGKVEELVTYKDQIFCFQNKGVSNILFNSRVQIPASDGVPIEISNSYKVDGYRYISDGIGCDDKRLVKKTPAGIYFVDSVGSHLFHISEQGMRDLSEQCNMTSWFKKNAGSIKKVVYDDINHDVYAVQEDQALCFSEKLNQFTGFYDYGDINLIETCDHHVFTLKENGLWKMFEGDYGKFFGANKPWSLTFISNGLNEGTVNMDKTFTNIEFRASVEGDGELDSETGKFTPALPFDSLETWNEYQHGFTTLENKSGHSSFVHGTDSSSLKRKFRIWRNDIPRNNYKLLSVPDREDYETEEEYNEALEVYNTWNQREIEKGISRKIRKPLDRMRNPWLYLKFQKEAAEEGKVLPLTEIHDIVMTYFT